MQLQRANKVIHASSSGISPLLVKQIPKLASASFSEGTNIIKGTNITSDTQKDRENLFNDDSNYMSFLQSDALWSTVLSAFYFKKRKLLEKALNALNSMLLCQETNLNVPTKIFMHPYINTSEARGNEVSASSNSVLCSVGEGVFEVLTEFLGTTSESSVQSCILFQLQGLLSDKGQDFLTGRSITRTLRSVFTVATWTCQEPLRECCHKVLKQCVLCVTRRFVKESLSIVPSRDGVPEMSSYRFVTTTPLGDYTTHVPPDAPYTRIDVIDTSVRVCGEGRRTFTASEELHQVAHDDSSAASVSFDPLRLFPVGLQELALRRGARVLGHQPNGLPTALKNFLLLLRVICNMASQTCLGSPNEGGVGLHLRQLTLGLLQLIFIELPIANCEEEHPCSIWMSLILSACGFEVIGCLVHNLSITAPFLLFNSAIYVLKLLLIKCHYHLGRELNAMLVVFLLPQVKSKYCDFRQKFAVLSMIRDLLSLPRLLISFFINYDCNPAIGADGHSGDMVEMFVDFVVELAYLDYTSGDREGPQLREEENQLLQAECFTIMSILTNSLYRWIAEDPEAPVPSLIEEINACRSGIERASDIVLPEAHPSAYERTNVLGESCGLSTTTDLLSTFKASYDTVGFSQSHIYLTPVSNANVDSSTEFSHLGDISQAKGSIMNAATLSQEGCVQYHWKHLHYQLNNKRIFKKAARMVNTGKWKEAKSFLESCKCLPVRMPSEAELKGETVTGGNSSHAEFARFLHEYPGITRDALSKIIEHVNKKGEYTTLVLLRDYFSLFHYRGVPIDIAFRDTLCKFVSWDAPMFEAQVWETIQAIFGEAYAEQNPRVITPKDADTMAGALLFLHTNLHNSNAKNTSISLEQFISASAEFLDFPPDVEYIRKIFERIKQKKWDLDMYDRTPQEVERQLEQDQTFSRLFTDQLLCQYRGGKLIEPHQFHGGISSTNLDGAAKDATSATNIRRNEGSTQRLSSADDSSGPRQGQSKQEQKSILNSSGFTMGEHEKNVVARFQELKIDSNILEAPMTRSVNATTFTRVNDGATNLGSSHDCDSTSSTTNFNASFSPSSFEEPSWFPLGEVDLLNSRPPTYTKYMGKAKARGSRQAESIEVSMHYLKKIEAVHMRFFGNYADYHPQPYIFPHYAEHVQSLLLLAYPRVMASIYLGFAVTEIAPLRWQLLETLQMIYDIAAVFMINMGAQQAAVVETLHRYLNVRDSHRQMVHAQAALVPLLLNHM
ncbi:unnamed protein product [Phytomonas sp. EM1]|nr:unnamed protein product [Phytomonas sp. EM1]|eukprot:CCW60370.1 unnamed protein product [Phytomonas sp. isolate EM1]